MGSFWMRTHGVLLLVYQCYKLDGNLQLKKCLGSEEFSEHNNYIFHSDIAFGMAVRRMKIKFETFTKNGKNGIHVHWKWAHSWMSHSRLGREWTNSILLHSFGTYETNECFLKNDFGSVSRSQIYAMDNINKEILWSYLLDEDAFEPFPAPSADYDVRLPLFIQRTYRHYPHPMRCTILLRDRVSKSGKKLREKQSYYLFIFHRIHWVFFSLHILILLYNTQESKNGVIVSFNPVTGKFG